MNILSNNSKADFLNTLKSETAAAHTQLEQLPISLAIVSPNVTELDYFNYLIKMKSVVEVLETNIFPLVQSIVPDLDQRTKSNLLAADLRNLKVTETKPIRPFVFSADISAAMALGVVYVIEGSSLGGRYILQNISASLGYDAGRGASYFNGHGTKTGTYWKHFLNYLLQYEQTSGRGDEIIRGANIAFTSIHNYFKG